MLDHPGQVGAPCPRAGVGIHGTSMGVKRFLPPSIGSGGCVQRQRHPLLWGEQGEQSTLSPAASKQLMATRALGAAAEGGQGRAPNQARKSSLEGKKGKTHKAERQSAVRESYQEILKHKARASPEGNVHRMHENLCSSSDKEYFAAPQPQRLVPAPSLSCGRGEGAEGRAAGCQPLMSSPKAP